MENKTVIVTGGGQGIGKAIAKTMVEKGMNVIIAEIDFQAGREAESELNSTKSKSFFIQTDVSNQESVKAMVKKTISKFGSISSLINNAGIANPYTDQVEKLDLADWNRIIGTNLTGMFLCAKHTIPHLRVSKGSIVNISSTRALMSEPNTIAYSTSKGGVLALTHSLAMSLGPDINVNAISPGWIAVGEWKKKSLRNKPALREIDHSQHPVGRVGKPEDIASMVLYLISDKAKFITGQNIVIDGGMSIKMIYEE
jgi:NAD(P)-dependent dehydrogenase (short-subunit alcohol dehydrogenase family)